MCSSEIVIDQCSGFSSNGYWLLNCSYFDRFLFLFFEKREISFEKAIPSKPEWISIDFGIITINYMYRINYILKKELKMFTFFLVHFSTSILQKFWLNLKTLSRRILLLILSFRQTFHVGCVYGKYFVLSLSS